MQLLRGHGPLCPQQVLDSSGEHCVDGPAGKPNAEKAVLCMTQRLIETSPNLPASGPLLLVEKTVEFVSCFAVRLKLFRRHVGPKRPVIEDVALDPANNGVRTNLKTVLEIAIKSAGGQIPGTDDSNVLVCDVNLGMNAR
jgi:hypothetical protein